MNNKSISEFETLVEILHGKGPFRWNQCTFLSRKHQHDADFPIRLQVKSSHSLILIAARTFEQAAKGVTFLFQLSHAKEMTLMRHCDWNKYDQEEDHDYNEENSWSCAFSTEQLRTILTNNAHCTVGFHHFTFSNEQSVVLAQHAVRLALHNCRFVDGGHAILQAFESSNTLRALSLHSLPWDPVVWKRLLRLMQVDELTLEGIAIDAQDSAFISTVPAQLSLLRCQFSDHAQRLCQSLAQTGGPQTLILEDDAHAQAQSCWMNLLACAVKDCSNVKTLGIHFPVSWNATNHLSLAVNCLRGNTRLQRLILRNVSHPQLLSQAMFILTQQTALKQLDLVDCPREHTDVMVEPLLNALTRNRQFRVQLQGKGAYWHRVQHERIEPQLAYNRLHAFAQQCQQTVDQQQRMVLLSSALSITAQQQSPARTQLLLSSNLDAFIAYMH